MTPKVAMSTVVAFILCALAILAFIVKSREPSKVVNYTGNWVNTPTEQQPIASLDGYRRCYIYKVQDGSTVLYANTCGGLLYGR